MKTFHTQRTLNNSENEILKRLVNDNISLCQGFKLDEITDDDMEHIEWDSDEKDFIDRYQSCELYMLLDCRAWSDGQLISVVAVE